MRPTVGEEAANAALIAAAPEMADALETLMRYDGSGDNRRGDGQLLVDAIDKARAALAKARGEK